MGLPGKPKGFDGSEVERYFREGKIKEVADYCETDLVGTYQVWLRYELFRGTLSQDAFAPASRALSAGFAHASRKRRIEGAWSRAILAP
jgi:predicted PolB exonuclease-like 3'-5' exonuclease